MDRDLIEKNVRLLMAIRGISQAQLARTLGYHHSRIHSILRDPTDYTIARLAHGLGVPPEWITQADLDSRSIQELRGERK